MTKPLLIPADDGILAETNTWTAAQTFKGTVTVGIDDTGYDLKLFGASAGAFMLYDVSEDTLEIRGPSADATTSTGKLLLSTALTDINANDVLGKIDFQAPLETGTDAITVAASIQAIAQGTFSGSVNATDLIFYTGHSEAATEKFRFTSEGEIGVGGANYGTDGQVLTSGGAGAAPAWEDSAAGDITGVTAGTGLSGGGSSGAVTLAVEASQTQITSVGALGTGSITSGFTSIDVGAGAITTTGTVSGGELALTGSAHLDSTPDDETVSGITATFTAGASLVRGDVCYFKAADSKMHKAVAVAGSVTPAAVAMYAGADISADASGTFLLLGFCRDAASFPTYTIGSPIYTPESGSVPEDAAPDSDGDLIQRLGWAVTGDMVFFNPSSDVIEHA